MILLSKTVSAAIRSCLMLVVLVGFLPPLNAQDASETVNSAPPETEESSEGGADETDSAEEVPEAPPEPPPFSLQPYRITISLAVRGETLVGQQRQEALLGEVRDTLSRMYGRMWNTEVEMNTWLYPASVQHLGSLQEADVVERYPEARAQKLFCVTVDYAAGRYDVAAREFDARLVEFSPVFRTSTRDVRGLSSAVGRVIRDAFRPVLMLVRSEEDVMYMQTQAGEFPAPDRGAQQVLPGDVLRPFVRYMERREPDKVRKLQTLPLTYVRVDEVERARVSGVLISHGLVPFGRRGRNLQQLALRQRPSASSSRIRLVLQARQDKPLISHRVDKVTKLRVRDQNQDDPVTMYSDRNGEVIIETDPENATFWLYVYSGSSLLARVPYAPGLLPEDTILLPDDSIRLAVEGELYLFRDELIDSVAQRAVFRSLAEKASAAGDRPGLDNALQRLADLPGEKEFSDMLNTIRVPAMNAAVEKRNRSAELRVRRLCDKMASSLNRFFSSEKQVEELKQIRKLRADADKNAATNAAASGSTTP